MEVVMGLDRDARVYLFGSVAEERHLLSSDIDILVVTRLKPGEVLAALWSKGIKDPFEIHVVDEEKFKIYEKRAKLVELTKTTNLNITPESENSLKTGEV
ncbi:MAG: nucleotidyltransferase domain-containing protein [Sulfolobales archaeon]